MQLSWALRALATANVPQVKRLARRQAAANLLFAERNFWREFGRGQCAGRAWFGQSFRQHAHLRDGNQRHRHEAFDKPSEDIMEPDGQGKHDGTFADNPGDAPDRLAQRQFFRAKHGHGSPRKHIAGDRDGDEIGHVFNRVGADGFVFETARTRTPGKV